MRFSPRLRSLVLASVVLLVQRQGAEAASLSIVGNTADAEAQLPAGSAPSDGGGSINNATKTGTLLAGRFNNIIISPVYVFALPVLGVGETISSVNVSFYGGRTTTTPSFNADLYGLGFRTASAVLGSDVFAGALDSTDATLLQDNFFTPTSATGAPQVTANGTGSTNLLNYVNSQYLNGAVGGDFIFLRLSPDFLTNTGTTTSGSVGYAVNPADSPTAGLRPTLSVTTVPEPTASLLGLSAFAATALFKRRR